MSERDPDDPAQERRDPLVDEETRAAAAEAGEVGGRAPRGGDPAERAVEEAGGGVAEGFEAAEQGLIDAAEHRERPRDADRDAFEPEQESDRSGAEFGEADHERSSERDEEADTE
jgi:hypothetical protein